MKIRRRATLVMTFEDSRTVVHDFLSQTRFEAGTAVLATLAALDEWTSMEDALAAAARATGDTDKARDIVKGLIEQELVVVEDSPQAERDQAYRDNWRWGAVAGFYHFGLRDMEFADGETVSRRLESYGGPAASPPLMTTNDGLKDVSPLPEFKLDDPFYSMMYRRRSSRRYTGASIPLEALSDCLFAGNGIQDIMEGGVYGRLPLAMTPSGGARNPFELYVLARAVNGLSPGIYHYSAAEHTLGRMDALPAISPACLLGDQEWANQASAIIFLCADFERSAWKYRQALAYRVVLMEVGAIVQNIQLAATKCDIASAPTGALSERRIEPLLQLDDIRQAAMFAVTLGEKPLS